MISKSLTFKSTNLGDNVSLLLCFDAPSADLFVNQFPIAWKVTTLAATGTTTLNATWSSSLSFCAAQVGAGSVVTAGNYIPIEPGQSTSLQLDTKPIPPVYHFSNPRTLAGGVQTIQAVNNTGGPTPIGLGFITGTGMYEEMNTAMLYPAVGNGLAVTGEFTPVLSAYIALDYQESQQLKADVQGVKPIWSKNLLSCGSQTTIFVRKNPAGGYDAVQLNANSYAEEEVDVPPMVKPIDTGLFPGQLVFEATLSFANPDAVLRGLQGIARQLLNHGYTVKLIVKNGSSDARVSLGVPYGTSCNQAEKAIMGIVENFSLPGRAAIKQRGGELGLCFVDRFSYWSDISPASPEWYSAVGEIRGATEGASTAAWKDVLKGPAGAGGSGNWNGNGYLNAESNSGGNMQVPGSPFLSPALLGGDLPPPSAGPKGYGPTRMGRKPSMASLAA